MHDSPNNFNLLRLLAAVAVLFSHGDFLYRLHLPVPFAGHSLGAVAVYVFFFISGYLIAQSWARSTSGFDFGAKRLGRIFPGLVVAAVVSVAVIGALMTTWPLASYWRSGLTWLNLVNNALGLATVQVLPGVFEHNPFAQTVNGSLWTIRYELLMYALLALISCCSIKSHRFLYLGFASILAFTWLALVRLDVPDKAPWAPSWFNDLWSARAITSLGVYFFIGSAFAAFRVRSSWAMGACGVLALGLAHGCKDAVWIQLGLWLGVPFTTFFLAHLGAHALRGRPHADLSYGVYIYAFPVQQAITQISLARGWPLAVCIGLSLLVTLVLAAVSWFGVEKPCIAWTRRCLSRRAA